MYTLMRSRKRRASLWRAVKPPKLRKANKRERPRRMANGEVAEGVAEEATAADTNSESITLMRRASQS